MSEREIEFLRRWAAEQAAYEAWGNLVAETVNSALTRSNPNLVLDLFLKVPVRARLKTEGSLIQKAFHRNKTYKDPYAEIEDKVGVRFVVLLRDDIDKVESAIRERSDIWRVEKARDFTDEIEAKPLVFDYQSVHFVVRSLEEIDTGSITIPADTPCEVQVRTLLQHAYSELTHDTLYKPSVTTTSEMKRAAAKSMALIEATDDYFKQVNDIIVLATADHARVSRACCAAYVEYIAFPPEEGALHSVIVDHFRTFASKTFAAELYDFIWRRPYIKDRIIQRRDGDALYRVGAILLIYFAVGTKPQAAMHGSPLTSDELAPIYSDLGQSMGTS